MEFKDYKEKQKYYKELAKRETVFWMSNPPFPKNQKPVIIKGSTYIKPKDGEK